MEVVFILLAIFGPIAAAIVLPFWITAYYRAQSKEAAHRLIAQAIEKGEQLDPQVLDSLTKTLPAASAPPPPPQDRARRTLGSAVVMLALALGFAGVSLLSPEFRHGGEINGMMFPAVILGALGLAFLVLAIIDYSSKKKQDQ